MPVKEAGSFKVTSTKRDSILLKDSMESLSDKLPKNSHFPEIGKLSHIFTSQTSVPQYESSVESRDTPQNGSLVIRALCGPPPSDDGGGLSRKSKVLVAVLVPVCLVIGGVGAALLFVFVVRPYFHNKRAKEVGRKYDPEIEKKNTEEKLEKHSEVDLPTYGEQK